MCDESFFCFFIIFRKSEMFTIPQITNIQLRIWMISRKNIAMSKLSTRFIDLYFVMSLGITGKENHIIVIELLLSTKDFQYPIHHDMHEESSFEL